jgi:phage recombination protein Bet
MTETSLVPLKVEYQTRFGISRVLTPTAVRKYLVSGKAELVTDGEIRYYMAQCHALGLDPYLRDCYLIKFSASEPAAIVTAKDYYIARAESHPKLDWWDAGIIVERECKPCAGSGMIKDLMCTVCEGTGIQEKRRSGALPRASRGEKLIGGWFEGQRKDRSRSKLLEADLTAYIRYTGQGQVTKFWKESNQAHMIRKVALAQGLRELLPEEFKGLFDQAEMPMETDLSEETIDAEAIDLTVSPPDLVASMQVGSTEPELSVVEPTAEEEAPLVAEEESLEAITRRALVKTFDRATEKFAEHMKYVDNMLFEGLRKMADEGNKEIASLPDLKAHIVQEGALQTFVADLENVIAAAVELEAAAEIIDKEAEEPPAEPPTKEKPPEDKPTEEELLGTLETAKKGTLATVIESYGEAIRAGEYGEQVKAKLTTKYEKLHKASIFDDDQPWGLDITPEPNITPEPAPMTAGEIEISTQSIRSVQVKMAEKFGRDEAENKYLSVLAEHKLTTVRGVTDHDLFAAILRDMEMELK